MLGGLATASGLASGRRCKGREPAWPSALPGGDGWGGVGSGWVGLGGVGWVGWGWVGASGRFVAHWLSPPLFRKKRCGGFIGCYSLFDLGDFICFTLPIPC